MAKKIITSESVTEGHPDKVCDKISDSLLDAYLEQDPESRVAIETLVKENTVILAGELTSKGSVNIQETVKKTLKDIGYDNEEFGMDLNLIEVISKINRQSPDIAQGVNEDDHEQGAGDQGLMYGYASNETDNYMPLPIDLAHKLTKRLSEARKSKEIENLGPDGKSQVSVEYEDGIPKRIVNVVIAQQHTDDINEDKLKQEIKEKIIKPVCNKYIDENTKYYINGTGKFIIGGPAADAGLTGRKIIVDTYGGIGRHGGGAFSGKDPSKVDRSAAYMARHIAKNIVAKGYADRCELQVAYCIGVAEPMSIAINTFGTSKIPGKDIEKWVRDNFSLKPAEIIKYLELKKPVFYETAAYGHFGRESFKWEKIIE
ncbi:MAG: methionine adenosyltransferase [Nanobdellota archaeon]